ncbi:MAG TPA: aspartate--tRNA ligase [Bacteroidales bacterium]|nr:aspartate--tRNA ligase [Bacteroidales bacterium]
MLRTHTCGELRIADAGKEVTLAGWLQRSRDLGGMTFIDLRDRYGLTQLAFNMEEDADLCKKARAMGREYVLQAKGRVVERSNKNPNLPTGDIEILVSEITVLNPAATPPFTIEENTDGGDELRMKFRYLDIRRNLVRRNLELRHQMAFETRRFLSENHFLEIETPVLIKSTPEGARDFLVPSRVHAGQFYALPQSPQTFKQLLMVGGIDRYFQIVKCFRDEDLRADRQPEFTQIDCEMSFVTRNDVLETFEGLAKHLFKSVKGINNLDFERISYHDAIKYYGSDKPDTRFGMRFVDITGLVKGSGFQVFDEAELVVGIKAEGCADYTRKQIDELTEWVRRPQIGAKGLVYVKHNTDGTFKTSVEKFFQEGQIQKWIEAFESKPGDLLLILAGEALPTRKALGELRLEMGRRLGLRNPDTFACLWVVDFPLLEWNPEARRYFAMHHPFTAPLPDDTHLLDSDPGKARANAYDMVINGVEVGGGSIRIFDRPLQEKMFEVLGFTPEEARNQFGFLLEAFRYGAPPHGGIAFGFDRLCALFGGSDSIRDFIAFPKNNAARDVMIDSPSPVDLAQLKELHLKLE